jgi:hypothetical protein
LVWFHFSIPKEAFVTWLAMRDALSISRKLLSSGFQGMLIVVFTDMELMTKCFFFFERLEACYIALLCVESASMLG